MSSSQVIDIIMRKLCGSCGAVAPHTPHTLTRASEAARSVNGEGGFVVKDEWENLTLVLHWIRGEWCPVWTIQAGGGTRFADEATAWRAARRWGRTIGGDAVVAPAP
jgi:hypothetical protein